MDVTSGRRTRRGAAEVAGPSERHLRMKTARVYRALERLLGMPRRARRPAPALDMLVATILSQNTSDTNSYRAFTRLRQRYRRWDDVIGAPLGSIRSAIRPGGIADQKSRRIKHVLREIRRRYGRTSLASLHGQSDEAVLNELVSLDGVGVKTAACVMLFSLRRDVFPVDTHVHRICGRLGLSPGSRTPEETFRAMARRVPPGASHALHTNMIRFGRSVCKANRPLCNGCPLISECSYTGRRRISRRPTPAGIRRRDFMLLDAVEGDAR